MNKPLDELRAIVKNRLPEFSYGQILELEETLRALLADERRKRRNEVRRKRRNAPNATDKALKLGA